MDKADLASYLASLISIMDSKDAAGGISRGQTLGAEYDRAYGLFMQIVRKEQADETRKRENDSNRGEGGTETSRD
jgi:hypothetical protein